MDMVVVGATFVGSTATAFFVQRAVLGAMLRAFGRENKAQGSKRILTATPNNLDLSGDVVPILPLAVLSGSPVTRTKQVLRSRDWTSNIVVWECTAGTFNWHYCRDEFGIITSGEVFVTTYSGEERRLGP